MTEIIVKILVELLSTLALATKQIQQGRLSKFVFADVLPDLMGRRKNCKKAFRREGRRSSAAETRSPHTRGGSDDCCADS